MTILRGHNRAERGLLQRHAGGDRAFDFFSISIKNGAGTDEEPRRLARTAYRPPTPIRRALLGLAHTQACLLRR